MLDVQTLAKSELRQLQLEVAKDERVLLVGKRLHSYKMSRLLQLTLLFLFAGIGTCEVSVIWILLQPTPQNAINAAHLWGLGKLLIGASSVLFLIASLAFIAKTVLHKPSLTLYLVTNQRIFRVENERREAVGTRSDIKKVHNTKRGMMLCMTNGDNIELDTLGGLDLE